MRGILQGLPLCISPPQCTGPALSKGLPCASPPAQHHILQGPPPCTPPRQMLLQALQMILRIAHSPAPPSRYSPPVPFRLDSWHARLAQARAPAHPLSAASACLHACSSSATLPCVKSSLRLPGRLSLQARPQRLVLHAGQQMQEMSWPEAVRVSELLCHSCVKARNPGLEQINSEVLSVFSCGRATSKFIRVHE